MSKKLIVIIILVLVGITGLGVAGYFGWQFVQTKLQDAAEENDLLAEFDVSEDELDEDSDNEEEYDFDSSEDTDTDNSIEFMNFSKEDLSRWDRPSSTTVDYLVSYLKSLQDTDLTVVITFGDSFGDDYLVGAMLESEPEDTVWVQIQSEQGNVVKNRATTADTIEESLDPNMIFKAHTHRGSDNNIIGIHFVNRDIQYVCPASQIEQSVDSSGNEDFEVEEEDVNNTASGSKIDNTDLVIFTESKVVDTKPKFKSYDRDLPFSYLHGKKYIITDDLSLTEQPGFESEIEFDTSEFNHNGGLSHIYEAYLYQVRQDNADICNYLSVASEEATISIVYPTIDKKTKLATMAEITITQNAKSSEVRKYLKDSYYVSTFSYDAANKSLSITLVE